MISAFSLGMSGEKLLTSWIVHDYGQAMSQRTIKRDRFLADPMPQVAVAPRISGCQLITLALALLITDGCAG